MSANMMVSWRLLRARVALVSRRCEEVLSTAVAWQRPQSRQNLFSRRILASCGCHIPREAAIHSRHRISDRRHSTRSVSESLRGPVLHIVGRQTVSVTIPVF